MLVNPKRMTTKVSFPRAALLMMAAMNEVSMVLLNALISFFSFVNDCTVNIALIFSPAIADDRAILSWEFLDNWRTFSPSA